MILSTTLKLTLASSRLSFRSLHLLSARRLSYTNLVETFEYFLRFFYVAAFTAGYSVLLTCCDTACCAAAHTLKALFQSLRYSM
eukprot:m.309342 g.309342  ORF g.309342 m.309342 type:complete len:84 (+) comp46103_c0_seq1:2408-2659(+)